MSTNLHPDQQDTLAPGTPLFMKDEKNALPLFSTPPNRDKSTSLEKKEPKFVSSVCFLSAYVDILCTKCGKVLNYNIPQNLDTAIR